MSKSAELRTSPLHNKQNNNDTIKDERNAAGISRDIRESSVKLAELEATFPKDLEGDELFQTNYVTNWTISDQYRLLAMDRLQARTLEYHNNVHQRFAFDHNSDISGVEPDDIVAQILYCSSLGSERPFTTTQAKLGNVLSQIKLREQKSRNSTSWVHLFDLCELTTIAECFNMHPLCAASFRDLRCHSNIVQSSNGFVVSLCYFQMNNSHFNVQMFKLYCYISHGLIVTFIAELMPETDVQIGAEGEEGGGGAEDDGGINICSTVLDRWTKIIKRTGELGPLYLFYEIALEAMNQQDSLIEFFSRTLFFFKKKTNLSLSHRKKVAFMRKMHIVMSAIQLIQFNVECISHIVSKLVLKAEASAVAAATSATTTPAAIPPVATVGSSIRDPVMPLVPGSLVGGDQLPYLYDLQDTCEFLDDCLKNEANEARILTDAMDSISQLKANNTAMLLSLVATIFLPVTFLTGVFGMNFTIDGGFTIDMVNNPNGPLLFYLMCGASSLITLAYYFSKGWIDVHTIQNYFSKLFFGRKKNKPKFAIEEDAVRDTVASNIDAVAAKQRPLSVKRLMKKSSVTSYNESDWRVQEAVEEEARRLAESARKRSRAQDVIKINARNSTIRFSTVNGSAPGPLSS